ncbi:MAG TPA: DUF4229 domain-containing protein [Natronosporangium sp.]
MNPLVKYTLGRIGLFAAALLAVWWIPQLGLMVKLLIALVVSFLASWFLLDKWRNEFASYLAARAERRRVERERLRAALAGDDEPQR